MKYSQYKYLIGFIQV